MTDDKKLTMINDSIKAIIVEDEERSQATLIRQLKTHCPEVKIIGVEANVAGAIKAINELKPQMLFLDIALPDGDGFNVLEGVEYHEFEVVFVTAYDKYAIRAFEFSAIHYLLKPIDHNELQTAVNRFKLRQRSDEWNIKDKLQLLNDNIKSDHQKLLLPTLQGFEIISLDDIIRLEASHNYTECILVNNQKIIVSKPLISFENILSDLNFVRVHNKHLVNLKFVKKYIKGQGGTLKMKDDTDINVSKSRKNDFLDKLSSYARHF